MSNSTLGIKAGRPSNAKQTKTLSDFVNKTDMVKVNFHLDKETHTRLKIYAAKNSKTISEILRNLINTLEVNT